MPVHARPRLALPLAFLLPACPAPGGSDDDAPATSTSTATAETTTASTAELPTGDAATDATTGEPVDDGRAFFVAGRTGDEVFILRVSPSTGAIDPFGPALPVAADELSRTAVTVRPDHSRIAVECYFESEASLAALFVGDGASWQFVTNYKEFYGGSEIAADASLFWFDAVADPDAMPTFQATVIDLDGDPVFTGPPLNGSDRFKQFKFAPEGAYFTFRDPARGIVLRTPDSAETVLPATAVLSLFPTSLIVDDGTTFQWLDLEAQPIDVPGFSTASRNTYTRYQIVGDQLSLLGDRVVTPVQKVPPGMYAGNVVGHYEGFVLGNTSPGVDLSTIGPDGAVLAGFTPEPTTNDPGFMVELFSWVRPVAACADCETRSVALIVGNDVIIGQDSHLYDRSVQLWRLDTAGGSLDQSLLRPWKMYDVSPRQFLYSADGAFLAWVEEGQIFRLDVAAGVAAPLDSPYTLIDP